MNICSIENCPNEVLVVSRGWCRKHYLRWYKHGDPEVKNNRWGEDRESAHKVCADCGDKLPLKQFYTRKDNGRPLSRCKVCFGLLQQRRYFLRKYGLSMNDLIRMMLHQNMCCGICKRQLGKPISVQPGEPAVVDHDHQTGKVRGLLCNRCNLGLGQFSDDADTVHSAFDWLTTEAVIGVSHLPD